MRKLLLCIALMPCLFIAACTRPADLARPGTLARWEALQGIKGEDLSAIDRSLAEDASSSGACLEDRMTLELLKAEAKARERAVKGEPLDGEWNGVALSGLSRPAGLFLRDYGRFLYDGREVSFSGCASIPCVINRIYGEKDDDITGWKAYAWYLRFGTVLAMDNEIPDQKDPKPGIYDGKSRSYKDYLFKEDELSGLWRVAKTMPDLYRVAPNNKSLHRIPHGACIEDQKCQACLQYGKYDLDGDGKADCLLWSGDVCGIASQSSWIVVKDACLEMDGTRYGGFFFMGVPHEMTHHLDYTVSKQEYQPYSETDAEFMKASGWKIVERDETYKDSAGNQQTRRVREWSRPMKKDGTPEEGFDDFVRDYAGTQPGEDFAETSAWLRYRPDEALKASPRKVAILSKLLFNGRTYDSKGLMEAYKGIGKRHLSERLLKMVEACAAKPTAGAVAGTPEIEPLDIDLSIPRSFKDCLNRGFVSTSGQTLAYLKRVEMEACDTLTRTHELVLIDHWGKELKGVVEELAKRQSELTPMLQASDDLRRALASKVDSREAYIHCFRSRDSKGVPNAQACYDGALSAAFDQVSVENRGILTAELLVLERERFMGAFPMTQAKARATELYKAIFADSGPVILERATRRWRECVAVPPGNLDSAGGVVLTQPFSGGDGFIAAQILNCVNTKVESDSDSIRDEVTGALFRIDDADAKVFVRIAVLQPAYLTALQDQAKQSTESEAARINEFVPGIAAALEAKLSANLIWVQGSASIEDATEKCKRHGEGLVGQVTATGGLPFTPLFHSSGEVRTLFASTACAKAVRSGAFEKKLDEVVKKEWSETLGRLIALVRSKAKEQGLSCWDESPDRNHAGQRMQRLRCMRESWDKVLERVWIAWDKSADGKRFAHWKREAMEYVTTKSRDLRDEAVNGIEDLQP